MDRKILFLLALAIPLLTMGAGCNSLSTTTPVTQPVTIPTVSTPDTSLTPTVSPAVVAPTPSSDGTRALVAAEPDATWVLYTNKALGYTVNTPTKGKYAPNWEMKYVDQSDPRIATSIEVAGCYFNINSTSKNQAPSDTVVVPDGTKFCHTKTEFGDPPSFFVVDDYATAVGKKFIVIEFTKTLASIFVTGCTGTTTEDLSLSEKVCIPFVASDYQATLDGIMGTFQMNTVPVSPPAKEEAVAQPAPDAVLEKLIISEKNELFQGYSKYSQDMASGYPVVFTTTTDPAVRYTILTNSGGDAMHTTVYFINQGLQKILQADTDVSGDFGGSGNLTLSLNGGPAIVISREQVVNDEKYEITYKGLRVNKEMLYTLVDPIILKPTSPQEFKVLGVTPDLTRVYFSDGLKQFAYDIVNDGIPKEFILEELKGLPLPSFVAKPITK